MKNVKTQNGKSDLGTDYKCLIREVCHYDTHIIALTNRRNVIVEQIKIKFNKTDENIEFELKKLRGK